MNKEKEESINVQVARLGLRSAHYNEMIANLDDKQANRVRRRNENASPKPYPFGVSA